MPSFLGKLPAEVWGWEEKGGGQHFHIDVQYLHVLAVWGCIYYYYCYYYYYYLYVKDSSWSDITIAKMQWTCSLSLFSFETLRWLTACHLSFNDIAGVRAVGEGTMSAEASKDLLWLVIRKQMNHCRICILSIPSRTWFQRKKKRNWNRTLSQWRPLLGRWPMAKLNTFVTNPLLHRQCPSMSFF